MPIQIRVQFKLQAPAPSDLVYPPFHFSYTNLIVLNPPEVNHVSNLCKEAHDGFKPVQLTKMGKMAAVTSTDVLMLTPEQLKTLEIKLGAGWEKPHSVLGGYSGPVIKMEAYLVKFPPEYYHAIEAAKAGDTLILHLTVDKHINLTLTVYNKDGLVLPRVAAAGGAAATAELGSVGSSMAGTLRPPAVGEPFLKGLRRGFLLSPPPKPKPPAAGDTEEKTRGLRN